MLAIVSWSDPDDMTELSGTIAVIIKNPNTTNLKVIRVPNSINQDASDEN